MKKKNNGVEEYDKNLKDEKPGRKKKYSRKRLYPQDYKELVKKKAYDIYQERVQSSLPGGDLSDWLQAEEELRHSNIMG